MKASTRRWVSRSALLLLALDLGAFAIAAPHARGWVERVRTSSLLRAGATAVRDLEQTSTRGAENAGLALLTRFTRHSGRAYAFILRATPPVGMRHPAPSCPQYPRIVMVETRCVGADGAAEPSSCPLSTCPKGGPAPSTASRSSALGLPTSALGVTVE